MCLSAPSFCSFLINAKGKESFSLADHLCNHFSVFNGLLLVLWVTRLSLSESFWICSFHWDGVFFVQMLWFNSVSNLVLACLHRGPLTPWWSGSALSTESSLVTQPRRKPLLLLLFFFFWCPQQGRHSLQPVPGRALSPHCSHYRLNLEMEADLCKKVTMLAAEIKRKKSPKRLLCTRCYARHLRYIPWALT